MGWLQNARNWLIGSRKRKSKLLGKHRDGRCLGFEPLEVRSLLSATPFAAVQMKPIGMNSSTIKPMDATPTGNIVNAIRGAYGLGSITAGVQSGGVSFNGTVGDGRGQTIAIVDAFDDPNALSDLNTFSTYFGLPTVNNGSGGPTFTQLNQLGQPVSRTPGNVNYVGPDPTGGWETEESLDFQYVHSIAPMANIILVEANSDFSPDLFAGVRQAGLTPGVVAVSMSFGTEELFSSSAQVATYDSYFATPAGHLGGDARHDGRHANARRNHLPLLRR